MFLLDGKIFLLTQVRQQKYIVPLTDRNQATPRGSLCQGQPRQVQTCWEQRAVLQSFTKLSPHGAVAQLPGTLRVSLTPQDGIQPFREIGATAEFGPSPLSEPGC